jgi:hypothetical protein
MVRDRCTSDHSDDDLLHQALQPGTERFAISDVVLSLLAELVLPLDHSLGLRDL